MALIKITYASLTRDIGSFLEKPDDLQTQIAQLTLRVLSQLSYNEIVSLEQEVNSHTGSALTQTAILTTTLITRIVMNVKKAKRDHDNLKEARDLINRGQLDEAVALLDKIVDKKSYGSLLQDGFTEIITKYRQRGETNKADALEAKLHARTL